MIDIVLTIFKWTFRISMYILMIGFAETIILIALNKIFVTFFEPIQYEKKESYS